MIRIMRLGMVAILLLAMVGSVIAFDAETIPNMFGDEELIITPFGYEEIFFIAGIPFVSPFPTGIPIVEKEKSRRSPLLIFVG